MNEVKDCLATLSAAFDEAHGTKHSYIEVLGTTGETVVRGNREGLVWLGIQLLKLADKAIEGSHVHIDEHGMADKAETNLVLGYVDASRP